MPSTTTGAPPATAFLDDLRAALLDQMPDHLERARWGREQILAHQTDRLHALLARARAGSPFHARRLAGIDLDAVRPDDLSALPVMTKADMMAELDDVFTDRRLTRRTVEESLAAVDRDPALPLGRYLALASGGASGQRGVFVLDLPGAVQFIGSLARGLTARLNAAGGPPPGGMPVAMVAAGSPVHATGFAVVLAGDGSLPFRFHPAPATLPMAEIVERLNAVRAPLLYGYPSMLARLAEERRAGRLRIDPKVVTSTSETCTAELRAVIRDGFDAPVGDTFGSTEGLVGASAPDEEELTFAEDGCIVELVDADGHRVPPGTASARVLITNLHNLVQPLIRYEMTDSFTAQPLTGADGHLRARVHGRADDTFRYGPLAVHPLAVRSVLIGRPEVGDYQVRQTTGGIDLRVVPTGPLDAATLREQLTTALRRAGLPDPRVQVDRTDRIDRDLVSGKLRRFVPLVG